MEEVDMSAVQKNPWGQLQYIQFGASGGNPLSPMFIAGDDTSLQGHHVVVSNFLDGFGQVPGCQGPLELYGGGYACDASVRIRRLEIWGPKMGQLTLKGPGYDGVPPNMADPVYGANAGMLTWEKNQDHVVSTTKAIGGGYGAHVIVGKSYVLEGLSWEGQDIVVEVSDPIVPDLFGYPRDEESIELTLRLKDGQTISCRPNAGESRKFHGADGISKGVIEAGALGDCGKKFRDLLAPPFVPTIPPSGECGCAGAEYDAECLLGGLGCSACGIPFCRYCGTEGMPDCKFGTSAPPVPDTTMGTTITTRKPTGSTTTGSFEPTSMHTTTRPTTARTTTATTAKATTASTAPPNPGCDCDGAKSDTRCANPGSDPYGGLGKTLIRVTAPCASQYK
jgi:hypothetical protein